MDDHTLDDLLRRLTALIVKIDERDTQMLAQQERLTSAIDELRAFTREQREFNRQQVAINQRLETLLERAWRSSANGQTD
jgi:hypothetical protein